MPDPGWYDDPLVPGGKRYWDGAAWTPNATGPGEAGSQPPAAGQLPAVNQPSGAGPSSGTGPIGGQSPPFEPIPAGVAATGGGPGIGGGVLAGGGFGDLSEWMNQTFRALRDYAAELFLLLFVIPAVFWAVGYLLLDRFVRDLDWAINDSLLDFDGVNASLLTLAGAAFVAMTVAWTLTMLAAHHMLYHAHRGGSPSLGPSLVVGLTRLPRMLIIGLVLTIAFGLILAIPPAIITFGVVNGGTSAFASVGLALVLGVVLTVLLVWLWVKTSFVWVSSAVVPFGTSSLNASFAVSRGRFWGAFARLGILVAMTTMLWSFIQVILQFAAPVLLFSQFDTDDRGRITIDGRDVSTINDPQFSDLLPNPFAALVYFGILVLISTLGQAVIASGTSALYVAVEQDGSVDGAATGV